jgi:hypothetical protein
MNAAIESLLRDMRAKLRYADHCERVGLVELADACGAVAANKLAQAIRIADRIAPEPQRLRLVK